MINKTHPERPADSGQSGSQAEGSDRSRTLSVKLFGPIELSFGEQTLGPRDFGGLKPKQILEILLVARGRPVTKDRLAELLWSESLPRNVSATLETYVSVLRKRLRAAGSADDLLVTQPGAYRFATEGIEVDLDRFDNLLQSAARGAARAQIRALEEALSLERGEILEDEPYADWAEETRLHYRAFTVTSLVEVATAHLKNSDHSAALGRAKQAIAKDPLNESAYRVAMLALYALGRQHEALGMFDLCRTLLAEELGVDPLEETYELHAALLRQEDPARLLPQAGSDGENQAGSALLPLLGRSRQLRLIGDAVVTSRTGSFALVIVAGEQGVGKSRLLDEVALDLAETQLGRADCVPLETNFAHASLASAIRNAIGDSFFEPASYPGLGILLPEFGGFDPPGYTGVQGLESVAALLRRIAPVTLILDNAHWADRDSIAAISYLQRRCSDCAVVVILAVRPEEMAHDHPVRQLRPDLSLRLEPLTGEDLAPLGISRLHDRTGGHPLFVAEHVAAIADHETDEIPFSLTEVVDSLCRAAGPRGHRVLLTASVLSQPFDPETLAPLLGDDPAALSEELERLCDRSLLRIEGPGFSFQYGIIREVLRDRLSPARRRLLLGQSATTTINLSPVASSRTR